MNWFRRRNREAELDAEIQAHLRMAELDKRAEGMSPEVASAEARREFGNVGLVKEITRAMWGGNLRSDISQDLRYAGRTLLKSPGFAIAVVSTLAFGLGANIAIFTVLNSIFLNPLPVARPAELASISSVNTEANTSPTLSYPNFDDLRNANSVFVNVAAFSNPLMIGLAVEKGAPSQRAFAELVSSEYFETLGLKPTLGRFFSAEEDRRQGTHPVIVLGYAAWQSRYGGVTDILGKTVRLNNAEFTIVGVAPIGFRGVNAVFGPDLWVPTMMTDTILSAEQRGALQNRKASIFRVAGRLKPGITQAQANANVDAIGRELSRAHPDFKTFALRPFNDAAFGQSGRGSAFLGTTALLGIAALVLLIACSNVANLLLARCASRQQEIAVRFAIGAGRFRILRQLLTENLLLASLAGIAGLWLAWGLVQVLSNARPPEFAQNLTEPKFDPTVIVFGTALSILTGLLFGIVPSLATSRFDLGAVLRTDARTAGRSRGKVWVANALLVGQVSFSLVALVATGLLARSVQKAYSVDPGFERSRLGVILIGPAQAGYDKARSTQYYRDARERASHVPGVVSAAWSSNLPLFGQGSREVLLPGREQRENTVKEVVHSNAVDPGFFGVSGIRLLHGREFSPSDREDSSPVAIVNETAAGKFWPGQNAVGQRIRLVGDNQTREVVGIARTANYQSLGEPAQPAVYLSVTQSFAGNMVLYVRTASAPGPILAAVQRELRAMDQQVSVDDARTAAKIIDQALWGARVGIGLTALFGLLGLGLASVGLYGVIAYSVNQRRREIAVRMALGATEAGVRRLILGQGMRVVVTGLTLGSVLAIALATLMQRVLFGVSPADPVALGIACLVLALAAAAASYLPAIRASKLDPIAGLRES